MIKARKLLDFYIKSSLHVALAVFSFVKIAQLKLNIYCQPNFEMVVFFGSILAYNFLKYYQLKWTKKAVLRKNKHLILINFFSIFCFIFGFLKLNFVQQIAFLKIGLLVLIYLFFRKFWWLKLLTIAFCVSFVVVYIQIFNQLIPKNIWLVFEIKLFVLAIALMIPFEIYDAPFDVLSNKTMVDYIGVTKSKIIGIFLLFAFFLLSLTFNFSFPDFVFLIITGVLIAFASEKKSKYYTVFWVESLPIFWWVLLLLYE